MTCPWPPDFLEILHWQWDEVVAPYWIENAQFAADHGVKIAIEMHPGFVVYSPETMLKLRAIAGPQIGCNFDPSHMFWQGIDPIAAIRVLGDAIYHVHAKDTQIYARNLPLTGVLDTKPYTDERNRAWIFRTCGYGHGEEWWREFVSTLRMFGYDYVLSIEHEDSLLSAEEGLTKAASFLNGIVLQGAAGRGMVGVETIQSKGIAEDEMPEKKYDAIVVGSGATGGFAAKELAERGLEVLVLEAGPYLKETVVPPGRRLDLNFVSLSRVEGLSQGAAQAGEVLALLGRKARSCS